MHRDARHSDGRETPRVLEEAPVIVSGVASPPLSESFANDLRPSEREAYYALSQNAARFGEQKSVEGIFGTNAMPIDHHTGPSRRHTI